MRRMAAVLTVLMIVAVAFGGCATAPFAKQDAGKGYARIRATGVQTIDRANPGIVSTLADLSKDAMSLAASYGPLGWVWAIPQSIAAAKADAQVGDWEMIGAGQPAVMEATLTQNFDAQGNLIQSVPQMSIRYVVKDEDGNIIVPPEPTPAPTPAPTE